MKNNLSQKGFIIPVIVAIIVFLIIVGGIYIYSQKKVEAPIVNNEENIIVKSTEVLGNKEDLVSFSVKGGDSVSGVLNLTGTVKNAYFFEGNIIVDLLDANQNILKKGNGMAKTEWMTKDPVSFVSTIDTTGLNGNGYILVQNDDPSGGEGGPAKKILIPVVFNNEDKNMMSIKLYFPNSILNPKMLDCGLMYPVSRVIGETKGVANATLGELIKGPTEEEKTNGYFSSIPVGTKVNSIKMVGDTLFIDFNEIVVGGGGSCGQVAKFNSFMTTLKQFTTIKDIKMTVDGKGNTEDIFQP
jgi:spore germination protein GerM